MLMQSLSPLPLSFGMRGLQFPNISHYSDRLLLDMVYSRPEIDARKTFWTPLRISSCSSFPSRPTK